MKLQLMKAGEQRLADALTNSQPIKVGYFRIGTNAGFIPGEGGLAPLGPLVYQGDDSNIAYYSASNDEANFFLNLQHDAGSFTVGNVMLFLEDDTPLLWGSLDRASLKSTNQFETRQVGAQITLVCTFWFPKLLEALDLSNLTHRVVRLPRLTNEKMLPLVTHAEWDSYTLDRHTKHAAPFVAFKNLKDGRWWGIPHMVHEDDPALNGVDGGTAGEGYGARVDTLYEAGSYRLFEQTFLLNGGDNWDPFTSVEESSLNNPPDLQIDAGSYAVDQPLIQL